MHDTAYEIGRLFFQSYVTDGNFILDIGSGVASCAGGWIE
jgi:hypothetical protein